MSRSFGWIFWGLIFTCLDFRINGFDLLPDLLGYGFIAGGSHGLARMSPSFQQAVWAALILAGFHLMDFFVRRWDPLFDLARTGADLALIWFLCGGIMAVAKESGWDQILQQASRRRFAYAVIATTSMLLAHTGVGLELGRAGAGLVLIIAMLTLMVMILILIYRVQVRFRELAGLPMAF